MKKLLLLLSFGLIAQAAMHFEKNQSCSSCHPKIYEEYKSSQHGRSTVFDDEIHAAVFNKHPMKTKKGKYRCAQCHIPTADNMKELLTPNNGVLPDKNNATQNEAIACAYCHRITDIKEGKAFNKNIIGKDPKVFFTKKETPSTSPAHSIVTNTKIFENGKLCMGCHARKSNKKGFDVCATDAKDMTDTKNCLSCHMPKVAGGASIMSTTTEHSFHGFPGLNGDISMLAKYVTFDLKKEDKKFTITVHHNVAHSSNLHPVRMSKLLVSVDRDGKVTKMKPVKLFKKIGTKGKPSAPWLATEIVHDSRMKPNSINDYGFDFALKSGDKVTVTYGHLLVKGKILKKFDLEDSERAKKFRVQNKKTFTVE